MQTFWNDSRSGAKTGLLRGSENSIHKVVHRVTYPTTFCLFWHLTNPRIHRAAVSYFVQMFLHNGRLSAQTLVITIKTTTVDRLNNDW